MRQRQKEGRRGSQKWLQRSVALKPEILQPAGLPPLTWLSPLAEDGYAEYLDAGFLERLELDHLAGPLAGFWPRSGPRWDGLARAGEMRVLVEAKAHIREFFSAPSAASAEASRDLILASLDACRTAVGADDRSDWSRCFYQYANRLAHLWWLREHGIDAHLLMVDFVNDVDVSGPASAETWSAAYAAAEYALGLPGTHSLTRYIHHVYPDVRELPQ